MRWQVKGVVQGVIAALPASDRVNFLFQRYVTRTVVLHQDWFDDKLGQAAVHWRNWQRGGGDEARGHPPARVLELGSGWHPVVALALALAGAEEVITVDRVALIRTSTLAATVRTLLDTVERGALPAPLPAPVPGRLAALRALAAAEKPVAADLERLGIRTLVADARATGLPAGSVELFVSNNTFEHIPVAVLSGILAHYRELAAPDAVNSHFVDMSDHYSHFDPSIGPLHFLRFEDRAWRKWDNDLVPQNRLRLADYLRLLEEAGLRVVDVTPTTVGAEVVAAVPLASRFTQYPPAELAVTHVWLSSVSAAFSSPGATPAR